VTVAEPLVLEAQVTLVCEVMLALKIPGWVMITDVEAVLATASVTVTV